MSQELELYRGTLEAKFLAWTSLLPEERKRKAAQALQERDLEQLWSLTEAHLALFSSEGVAVSRHTLRVYKKALEQFLEYSLTRALNLFRLRQEEALIWIRHLEATANNGQPYAPKSVQVKLAAIREFYRALRWTEATEAHPFEDLKPKADKTAPWDKRKPYRNEVVEALLEQARLHNNLRDEVLVLLGAHAALRMDEVCKLGWEQVHWGDGELEVQGKGGKIRRVRMSKSLREKLSQYKTQTGGQGMIFGVSDVRLRDRLKRLCAHANVDYKAFHPFRHYAGTRLKQEGADLETIARHHGHASIETTRIYAKWSDEVLGGILEGW